MITKMVLAAGQRCMAVTVGTCPRLYLVAYYTHDITAVLVGEAQAWLPELCERAQKLKTNGGFEKGTDLFVLDYTSSPTVHLFFTGGL